MKEKYASDIRIRIEPAVRRICEQTDLKVSVRSVRQQRGKILFVFRLETNGNQIGDEYGRETPGSEKSGSQDKKGQLQEELKSFGLSEKQTRTIIRKYPPEQIRRNIGLTRKKAADGEIRNIPGFLTDAIRDDYAKDQTPADGNLRELVAEARRCWQKTKGSCQAAWDNYKDDKSHACHHCKKFAEQRNQPAKSEVSEGLPDDTPESLCELIPVKVTNVLRKLVSEYHRSHGAGYVRRCIGHTNQHITDKRRYRAVLEKSLAGNLADQGTRKEKGQEKSDGDTRFDQHQILKKQLKVMPESQIEELRAGCLGGLKPFMRKRLEKMPVGRLVRHPSFLDYCAGRLPVPAGR